MSDFVIQYITISNEKYLFHNFNVTERLKEISNKQIVQYLEYLSEQKKLCELAILAKERYDRKFKKNFI